MEKDNNKDKIGRVLALYNRLLNGYVINKAEAAQDYGVNERSIQRDIEDIREFMDKQEAKTGISNTVIYDRNAKGYRMEQIYQLRFDNSEILAICKILLDSRAFTKNEMLGMIDKLVDCCVPKSNQKLVMDLIQNEEFHYIEPQHKTVFIDKMWEIGQAIQQSRYIEIDYQGMKGSSVKTRKLKPVAIMFSDYYFYMAAYHEDKNVLANFSVLDDAFPTIYRIDRIQRLKTLDESFKIPYKDRFEEGEFRKRIQFMFGGKLRKVKFKYKGMSLEAVLDRLPTAKVLSEEEEGYIVSAEVFGDGIDMWLRSQGENIAILDSFKR